MTDGILGEAFHRRLQVFRHEWAGWGKVATKPWARPSCLLWLPVGSTSPHEAPFHLTGCVLAAATNMGLEVVPGGTRLQHSGPVGRGGAESESGALGFPMMGTLLVLPLLLPRMHPSACSTNSLTKNRWGESVSRCPTSKTHAGYSYRVKKESSQKGTAHSRSPQTCCKTCSFPSLELMASGSLAEPFLILLLQCENASLKNKIGTDRTARVSHKLLFHAAFGAASEQLWGRAGAALRGHLSGMAKQLAAGTLPCQRLP